MGTGILITFGTMLGLGLLILIVVLVATRGVSSSSVNTTTVVSENTNKIDNTEIRMNSEELVASTGLKILCFFVPIVGLLIYSCNISLNRKFATDCGKWSLISFLITMGLVGAMLILSFIIAIINSSAIIV